MQDTAPGVLRVRGVAGVKSDSMCERGERMSTPLKPPSTRASAAQHSQFAAHSTALTAAEAAAHTGWANADMFARQPLDLPARRQWL